MELLIPPAGCDLCSAGSGGRLLGAALRIPAVLPAVRTACGAQSRRILSTAQARGHLSIFAWERLLLGEAGAAFNLSAAKRCIAVTAVRLICSGKVPEQAWNLAKERPWCRWWDAAAARRGELSADPGCAAALSCGGASAR